MSYAHIDDQSDGERLTALHDYLSKAISSQLGQPFTILRRKDIPWGQNITKSIANMLNEVMFLIPIITPGFFKDETCREEVRLFLKQEKYLGRDDLIFPIYYINYDGWETDELAQVVLQPKPIDWRDERFKDFHALEVQEKLNAIALYIRDTIERRVPPVHFVNREYELQQAYAEYAAHHIFFDAPSGYGKTALLQAIEWHYFGEGWLCISVETPNNIQTALELCRLVAKEADVLYVTTFPDSQALGYSVAAFLNNKIHLSDIPGILFLIDSVERLPHSEVYAFLTFLKTIRLALTGTHIQVRIHLAGRSVGLLWERTAQNLNLQTKVISLSPFQLRYVRETVRLLQPSQQELDLRASYLMHVTGGHPFCMANILQHMDYAQPVDEHFNQEHARYQKVVFSIADAIRKGLPIDLRDIFDALSIFRRYNNRLLDAMVRHNVLRYHGGVSNLVKALIATDFVKRRSGFIQDTIVRRLLAIDLRQRDQEQFLDLCRKARNIYLEDLQTATDRPEQIAVEGLYQELQLRYYAGDGSLAERADLWEQFFADDGILNQFVYPLMQKQNVVDCIENLLALIQDENGDWEIRFAVNFFLRGDTYSDEPFEKMIRQIEHVLEQVKE